MKNTHYIAFDIETEPLGREWILSLTKPFRPFVAERVKTGDCKTPETANAKIAVARAKHEAEAETYYKTAVERGALAPETGRVLSIGFFSPDERPRMLVPHLLTGSDPDEIERRMLAAFWARWHAVVHEGGMLLSWNGSGFDLPFILRRSWIQGIPVPNWARRGRHFHSSHVDLMQMWVGYSPHEFIKLDIAARVLGIGSKSEQEVTGARFAEYYHAGGDKRELAMRYALRDIELTARVGEIMLGLNGSNPWSIERRKENS